jgi:hypothetical protein
MESGFASITRDEAEYDFRDEDGNPMGEISPNMVIHLIPLNQKFRVRVTWYGFDNKRLPIRLGMNPTDQYETHQETLQLWKQEYGQKEEWRAKVADIDDEADRIHLDGSV